jgi:hypothetical protein
VANDTASIVSKNKIFGKDTILDLSKELLTLPMPTSTIKSPCREFTFKWVAAIFATVASANATLVAIENGSFETPSDLPSGFTSVPPPSWTATLAPAGDVLPEIGVFRLTEPPLATHGLNAAYISANPGGTGSLTYSGSSLGNFSDFLPGTRFNFIAAVSGDPGTSFTLELLASGVPVATFTRSGNFKFESIGGAFILAGQTGVIGVRLSFTNNDGFFRQGLFDNVTLDTTRIVIDNHSFENPSSPDGNVTIEDPPSWTGRRWMNIESEDPIGVITTAEVRNVPNGVNVAYIESQDSGSASLTYSGSSLGIFSSYPAGSEFLIKVAVRGAVGVTCRLGLLENGVEIAHSTQEGAGGDEFSDLAVRFIKGSQNGVIGIQLSISNASGDITRFYLDHVRIDVTAGSTPFGITAFSVDKNLGTTSLTWGSNPGVTYQVEASPNLVTWSPWLDENLLPINYVATGTSTSATHSNPSLSTTPLQFYRVRTQP